MVDALPVGILLRQHPPLDVAHDYAIQRCSSCQGECMESHVKGITRRSFVRAVRSVVPGSSSSMTQPITLATLWLAQ